MGAAELSGADAPPGTGPFKRCGACGQAWRTWEDFVGDPAVKLLGLQAVPTVPDASVLVFEHRCGSSISVLTRRLHHLLPADDPTRAWPSLRGTDECARHCFSLEDHAPCDRHCRNARDRELLAVVQLSKRQ